MEVYNRTKDEAYEATHTMTPREVEMVLHGSQINVIRRELA